MSSLLHDFITFPFLRNACVAAVLAALAAGVTGSLVVVRRSTYLAGAVSHSVLAGIGLSLLLSRRFGFGGLSPIGGAVCVAVAVALLLAFLARKTQFRPDTILSAIWTTGMALGISFVAATPGYQEDLMSYLFGSILLVPTADLWWMGILDLIILSVTLFCYNRFLAIAFNEELTRLRGVRTGLYETLYHILTALTVVLLVRVAGIVLAVALLTLPAATAGLIVRRLNRMMALAVALAIVFSFAGIGLSYCFDWPPGATIVELAAVGYFLTAFCRRRICGGGR
ncbi:MAG: metal ABC transporter permease [Kiritimatiellae bacterium]|nr:metal ABC transporter permease [Kiritimatiellia bacterium]MBP5225751.1 metal ABC transporter permease [Kiritimatiellia bacterium]